MQVPGRRGDIIKLAVNAVAQADACPGKAQYGCPRPSSMAWRMIKSTSFTTGASSALAIRRSMLKVESMLSTSDSPAFVFQGIRTGNCLGAD